MHHRLFKSVDRYFSVKHKFVQVQLISNSFISGCFCTTLFISQIFTSHIFMFLNPIYCHKFYLVL